ncbi:MAG TPA: hypothetical protein VHJ17_10375 [Thermomonospora sp.]|nr:hypothetical protein [Thermomonospora sp.]
MPRTQMIADWLRAWARWRIDLVEEGDCGRNARVAIALIDAAEYVTTLEEHAQVVIRLAVAGCFADGRFDPGPRAERILWEWDRVGGCSGPVRLLDALAAAAEERTPTAVRRPGPYTADL